MCENRQWAPAPRGLSSETGNIRGNIQIVHYVHCFQIRARSGRNGRIGRI
jgi:hypothetical protein